MSCQIGQLEGPGIEQLAKGYKRELDVQSSGSHGVVQRCVTVPQQSDHSVRCGHCTLQHKVLPCQHQQEIYYVGASKVWYIVTPGIYCEYQ